MEKGYFRGIIGSLLGGIIASIPWILVYVYANMIYAILAIIVAMGALKGYQLFGGKVDKKLPVIITVISFVSITISTLVIIPFLLLLKSSSVVSISNFIALYSSGEFASAILIDYITSVVFTFLGISGVIANIKRQVLNNDNGDIKISFSSFNNKKERLKIKDYFVSRNAINEMNSISINENEVNIDTLELLITEGIVIRKDNKYYYLLDEEERLKKKNKKVTIITFSVVLIVILAFIFATFYFSDSDYKTNDFYYSVGSNYEKIVDKENDNSWFYVPTEDKSGDSGYIMVYYLDGDYKYSSDWVNQVKDNFNYEDLKQVKEYNSLKNDNDLDVVFFDLEFEEYDDKIYYIFGEGKLAVVEVIDYGELDYLNRDTKDIVNSFKWN